MTTTLFLTVDLHVQDIFGAENLRNDRVWLCLQPHVVRDNDLKELRRYVDAVDQGGLFEYRFVTDGPTIIRRNGRDERQDLGWQDFIPVNLPSDLNVAIVIETEEGAQLRFKNERTEGMEVLDAPLFTRDNRAPRPERPGDPSTDIDPLVGPMARTYNAQLQDAFRAALNGRQPREDLTDLADQLMSAFWIGPQRRIRTGRDTPTMRPGDVSWMEVPADDEADGVSVTNLHSLLGLMFNIANGKQDLEALSKAKTLIVELSAGGQLVERLDISDYLDGNRRPEGQKRFVNFCQTIGDFDPGRVPPLSVTVPDTLATRVITTPQMTGLTPTKLDEGISGNPELWYRYTPEKGGSDGGVIKRHALSDLSRVTAFVQNPRGEDMEVPPRFPSLVFELGELIEGRVQRYRGGGGTDRVIARFIPNEADRHKLPDRTDPTFFSRVIHLDDTLTKIDASKMRYLGTFDFAWEDQPAILFLVSDLLPGDALVGASGTPVTLMRRVRNALDAPAAITLTPAGSWTTEEGRDDSSGPRWQWDADGAQPDLEFDILRLQRLAVINDEVDLNNSEIQSQAMTVSVGWKGDATFRFSHSAARSEGLLKVDYPDTDAPLPGQRRRDITQAQLDVMEDLVNHNTLNIRVDWNDDADGRDLIGDKYLNRFAEIPGFWSTADGRDQERNKAIAFRYVLNQSIQEPPQGIVGEGAKEYFLALYDRLGTPRTVSHALEHTYGTDIDISGTEGIAPLTSQPTPIDIPPILPQNVTTPDVSDTPFLTVTLHRSRRRELIQLTFDTHYLNPAWAPAPQANESEETSSKRGAHYQALRALCELAWADRLELEGRFLAFDFASAATKQGATSLLDAMTDVPGFEGNGWPMQLTGPGVAEAQDLKLLAQRLLEQGPGQGERFVSLELRLDPRRDGHPVIGDVCNVVEFSLRLTRADHLLPQAPDGEEWKLERYARAMRLTRHDGWRGALTDRAEGEREAFDSYLAALASATAPIAPSDTEEQEREGLRELLGDTSGNRSASWLVPNGLTSLSREAVAAVGLLPIGFRPLKFDPRFGIMTEPLLRKYTKALATVLALEPGTWLDLDSDPNRAWQNARDLLQVMKDSGRELSQFASDIARLAEPVHSIEGGDAQQMDPIITRTLELMDADRDYIIPDIAKRLLKDFDLYGRSKAFLFTRLTDDRDDAGVTKDFYRWQTSRDALGTNPVTNRQTSTLPFRSGLVQEAGTNRFGFLEDLDDTVYKNRFNVSVNDSQAQSFEGLIENVGDAREEATIGLQNGRVRVPYRAAPVDDGAVTVYLPSREPMREPTVAALPFFTKLQDSDEDDWAEEYRDQNIRLSQARLFEGSIVKAGTADAPREDADLRITAASAPLIRNPQLDDQMVSIVMRVFSDEENSFTNDLFEFVVAEEPFYFRNVDPTGRQDPNTLDELFYRFLADIQNANRPHDVPNLEQVIPFIKQMQLVVAPRNPKHELIAKTEQDDNADTRLLRLEVVEENGVQEIREVGDSDIAFDAYLLAAGDPPPPGNGAQPYYLLVNMERAVWAETHLSMVHTRNKKSTIPGPDFSEVFWRRSRLPASAATVSWSLPVDASDVQIVLPRRSMSWAELKDELINKDLLYASDKRDELELAISIHQLQEIEVETWQPGQFRTEQKKGRLSSYPLTSVTISPDGHDDQVIDFPIPYGQFDIDLQWFSRTNRSLFRIQRLRGVIE